jgi:hypothetical protein
MNPGQLYSDGHVMRQDPQGGDEQRRRNRTETQVDGWLLVLYLYCTVHELGPDAESSRSRLKRVGRS